MQPPAANRWDIFCRVVDNYGDIGVCWRLARQLAKEYPVSVRLWVDDIHAFVRIWPTARIANVQTALGVEVCLWPQHFGHAPDIADVVIEAFACELPASYIAAMAAHKRTGKATHWFNMEYLSAESWIEDCHGLFSLHPPTGMKKAFFFPGFTDRTGGLPREEGLLARCQAWQADPRSATEWFRRHRIATDEHALRISLFAYNNPAIESLLVSWQHSQQPIHCLVAETMIVAQINQSLGTTLGAGDEHQIGQLRVTILPWLDQDSYDELLWSCDINFVRGEDSFVRAQWAGKPMVWQIYPQEDGVHLDKLNAFLDVYTNTCDPRLDTSLRQLWQAWNASHNIQPVDNKEAVSDAFSCRHEKAPDDKTLALAWQQCIDRVTDWQQHSKIWPLTQNSLPDLASQLMLFVQKPL